MRPAGSSRGEESYCKLRAGERALRIFLSPLAARALAGLALASAIAVIAKRQRVLSASGAGAATAIGTASTAAGWSWSILLIAFFITGTLLSRAGQTVKRARAGDIVQKGGERDAWQVLANGGVFAAAAAASMISPSVFWPVLGAGAIAASAADTWATEIGMLSRETARSIATLGVVPTGTSGGVTFLGTAGAFSGALFIAVVTFLLGWPVRASYAAVVGGISGSLLDSLVGATLQARWYCPRCSSATERQVHVCGTRTTHAGGLHWLNNDGVNAIGSFGGAMIGALCLL